ncbi:unnamed protein product [Rotaria sp. Silwood1]|nr:unnamed protein product [Rotaria sp. Silwood1]
MLIEGGFPGSTLLKPGHKSILNEFYGNQNQQWTLMYKASRHGFDAASFHSHCDQDGETITIIQSNNGYLFGGYTSVPWSSSGDFESDATAFLFTLTNPHAISPTKYSVVKQFVPYAVCHNGGFGPTFGCGLDLYVATDKRILNKLRGHIDKFDIPKEFPYKESFSDLDVLIVCPSSTNILKLIKGLFNPKALYHNGGGYSFDFELFQID